MSPTDTTLLYGIDLSFASIPDATWAKRRVHDEGITVLVQCLWTGGFRAYPALRSVASRNLRFWREAGGITAGYINTSPWYSADVALYQGKETAGVEWPYLRIVFNDVELEGVTEGQIRAVCEALRTEGKGGHVYTAYWFWFGKLGNPQWEWTRNYGLWNAYYDLDPDIDFSTRPYGLWTLDTLVGEQYQGTVKLDGVEVDRNVFNRKYFERGEDMPLTEDDFKRIENLIQAHNAESLIRDPRDGKVYHYALGMRGHIQNPAILEAAGFDVIEIRDLDPADIDAIPTFEDKVRAIVRSEKGTAATAAEIIDELVRRLRGD